MIWALAFCALVMLAMTAAILAKAEQFDDSIDNLCDEVQDELEGHEA